MDWQIYRALKRYIRQRMTVLRKAVRTVIFEGAKECSLGPWYGNDTYLIQTETGYYVEDRKTGKRSGKIAPLNVTKVKSQMKLLCCVVMKGLSEIGIIHDTDIQEPDFNSMMLLDMVFRSKV